MSALARLAKGTTFASDYQVVSTIYEGERHAVYAAEQQSTGKTVALKVHAASTVPDEEARRRFVEEARVGGKISSPYVIDVRGAGIDEATGFAWVVMELLDGQSLGEALTGSDPKTPLLLWDEVLTQLLRGVTAIHAAGVSHGALAPVAVFLARSTAEELRLQLLEVGVPAPSRSQASVDVERLPYLPPERVADPTAAAAPTMDVWSIGMIAFRMLTGLHYFAAANGEKVDAAKLRAEIAKGVVETASARARALGVEGELPVAFDAFFSKCTVTAPGGRFANGAAALEGATDLLVEASALSAEITEVNDETPIAGVGRVTRVMKTVSLPAPRVRQKPPPLPPMVRVIAENPKPAVVAILLLTVGALGGGFGLGALRGARVSAADQARTRAATWAMKSVTEAKKACDGGEAAACSGLGQIYLAGAKAPRDEAMAVQLFTSACDKGDMPSCGLLAAQYLSGEGTKRNPGVAIDYYRKACEGGDNLSCADLADVFENGNGVPKDPAKARELLDKACKAGYREVCK